VEDFDDGMDNSFLCEVTKPKFPSFASTRRVTHNKMKISRSSWVTKSPGGTVRSQPANSSRLRAAVSYTLVLKVSEGNTNLRGKVNKHKCSS